MKIESSALQMQAQAAQARQARQATATATEATEAPVTLTPTKA